MIFAPKCIVPSSDKCGEAVTWSASENALYWCDINRFLIHKMDYASRSVQSFFFDEPVVAISLSEEKGRLLVALASKLIWWWPEQDLRVDHGFKLDGFPDVRFNDGRADPLGNFWVGSMKNNVLENGELCEPAKGMGKLFRVTPKGDVSVWRDKIGISNTLCWSPDHQYFYFADTLENIIYRYNYNVANGEISSPSEFFSDENIGLPDGSSMDSEGNLWNCRYGGKSLLRISAKGKIIETIQMPVTNITTCTFGGPGLTTLFVTTAGQDAPYGERLAGSLYAIDTDIKGQSENYVKIG